MKKILGISIICLVIDQIIKRLVVINLEFLDTINIIKNFFRITYVKNMGAAWSILSGSRIFLIVITLIALTLLILYIIKNKKISKIEELSYGILIGGIIGNLFDRIRLGYVIDYLDINFGSYHYPVFNFADICIVVSIIILLINSFKEVKNEN